MTTAQSDGLDNHLQAEARDTTRNPRQLRAAGLIPATVYGPGRPASVSIQVPDQEFMRKYQINKQKQFILDGIETGLSVRVKQVQLHSLSRRVLNIEFMTESATA